MGRKALAAATVTAGLGALLCLGALAQYPGQARKTAPAKEPPPLRSIAVVEWTGDPGSPKAARLVPVLMVEGEDLHDGANYMARPQPLAIAGEVEYELEQNGHTIGLFDVEGTAQEQGGWVGYGKWKDPPAPKPKADPLAEMAKLDANDADSDKPVLHRKHPAGEAKSSGSGGNTEDSGGAKTPAPVADPDRPTLHKKDPGSDTDAGAKPADSSKQPAPDEAPDTDRPTIRRRGADAQPAGDPDRPVIKKGKKKKDEDVSTTNALAGVTDPDRPRLKRGKSDVDKLEVRPSLMGMPAEMRQTVAVSDVRDRPEHTWSYRWANPEDEQKMKDALEDQARQALGLSQPPPPPAPPAKKTPARKGAKPAPPPPPEPAPLEDVEFRVFQLSYGAPATLVLSARSAGAPDQRKYVTLIAQPDFYGNAMVLFSNVTSAAHLEEQPRMRLVDAVDALADNRGELLFELRGATQRQFVLYRVLRGRAEPIFSGGAGEFVSRAE